MPRAKNLRADLRLHSQLLTQVPHQPRRRSLFALHFPARKFPHQCERATKPPLADQNLSFRLNQPSHHSQHAVSRISRARLRAPLPSGGPGVFKSSSRTTSTRPLRTAGTSCQEGFRKVAETFARPPVAAQANTINSGAARAPSSSVTRSPAPNTTTQGGDLLPGFGQASQ